jgi:hypothetical protein
LIGLLVFPSKNLVCPLIWYDTISNISSQLPKSKIFCILGGRLLNAASAGAKTVYGPAMAIKKIKPSVNSTKNHMIC